MRLRDRLTMPYWNVRIWREKLRLYRVAGRGNPWRGRDVMHEAVRQSVEQTSNLHHHHGLEATRYHSHPGTFDHAHGTFGRACICGRSVSGERGLA